MEEEKKSTTIESESAANKPKSKKIINSIKTFKSSTKIIIGLLLVIVVIASVFLIFNSGKEGKVTTISETALQKIIEINELSTVNYTYNATVAKHKENSSDVMYYVAYEGTVTAGIDFQKIVIDLNEADKIITITIPEIEIHDISVNMGTLDYIFVKDKYETETISQEAYKLCKADLENRLKDEPLLKDTAKENAITSVESLFTPWIETVDKEYKVIIK